MISKEAQYRIYAGTRKDDFDGWDKVDVEANENVDFWTLDIGNGYFIDRVTKSFRTLLGGTKKVKYTSIHRDRSILDPEGEYQDADFIALFDVDLMVSNDAIKFTAKNSSYVILSREPIDWDDFSEGIPKFEDKTGEENWSSFYQRLRKKKAGASRPGMVSLAPSEGFQQLPELLLYVHHIGAYAG